MVVLPQDLTDRLLDRGVKHNRATHAVAVLRSVAVHLPENVDWETLSETEIERAFRNTTNGITTRSGVCVRRCLLKLALTAVTNGSAKHLWPVFWTSGRIHRHLTQREITVENAMPYVVYQKGPVSVTWLLFQRIMRQLRLHSAIRRPSTMRRAMTFLWQFLSVGLQLDLTSDPLETLQRQSPTTIVAAYHRYRDQRPPVQLNVLKRHVYLLSVLFYSVLKVLKHPFSSATFGIPKRHCCDDTHDLPWLASQPTREEGRVHTFRADEIRALYLACSTLLEKIIMTTLFTTGMQLGLFL